MKVEIVKPVLFGAQITRTGVLDVPESIANHWVATGAAKLPEQPKPVDAGGQKKGY